MTEDESRRSGSRSGTDPHADQPVVTAGAPATVADAVVVALHGRGATAQGIVNLAEPLYRHGVTFVAPQAERSRWFQYAVDEPLARNNPHVSSALDAVERVLGDVADWGVPRDRVLLFGFSQGACLACEYAARNPQRFGGVVALSGSLLGALDDCRAFAGSSTGTLAGAPVFLGYGEDDARVSADRISETAAVFRGLDGDVTERVYENLGHEVTDDEFEIAGSVLDGILAAGD